MKLTNEDPIRTRVHEAADSSGENDGKKLSPFEADDASGLTDAGSLAGTGRLADSSDLADVDGTVGAGRLIGADGAMVSSNLGDADADLSALNDVEWLDACFADLAEKSNYVFARVGAETWTAYGGPANLGSAIISAFVRKGVVSFEVDSGLTIPAEAVVEANALSMFKNGMYILSGFDPLPSRGGCLRFSFALRRETLEDADGIYNALGKAAFSLRTGIPHYLQAIAGASAFSLFEEEHEDEIAQRL